MRMASEIAKLMAIAMVISVAVQARQRLLLISIARKISAQARTCDNIGSAPMR